METRSKIDPTKERQGREYPIVQPSAAWDGQKLHDRG